MLRKARPHFLAQTDLKAVLQPADENGGAAMTKLIATAGPACNSVETLSALLEAGMNVLRIDLTWGSLAFHRRTLQNLQRARQRQKRMAAVMIDTLGREMMIKRAYTFDEQGWPSHTEALHLRAGQQLVITARGNVEESKDVLPITYPRFPALVRPGDLVYVGRYLVCGAPDLGSLYLKARTATVAGP